MSGLLAVIAAVGLALSLGVLLGRRGQRLSRDPHPALPTLMISADDLGRPLGERATLVQFSTAFCQPCRATRRVLADVAGKIDGVAHVEIDAESHLDLVRRLDVRRTPTVFVLDRSGRVIRRASGQPRPGDAMAAVGAALDDETAVSGGGPA